MKQFLSTVTTIIILTLLLPQAAFAVTEPTFPSCTNPQGAVKAHYDTGIHGIAGNSGQFTGADTVYTLTNGTLLQCYCPNNGQGIQTNWWDATTLSSRDIQTLQQNGWIYEPFGADWGLNNDPYLAKNTSYTCAATAVVESTVQENTNTGHTDPTSTVAQLANTGNSMMLYGFLIAGISNLAAGLHLRKRK